MKGTEDELQFGDVIEMDFTKDMPNGKVKHYHMEYPFLIELLPMLLEDEVIEEREFPDEEDACDEDCILEGLLKTNEALELRVDKLEAEIMKLRKAVNA